MMQQSQQNDIPQELRQHLLDMGILKPENKQQPREEHVAWSPTHKGEEPPF